MTTKVEKLILQKSIELASQTPDTRDYFQFNVRAGYSLNASSILSQILEIPIIRDSILDYLRKYTHKPNPRLNDYCNVITDIVEQTIVRSMSSSAKIDIIYRFTDPADITLLDDPSIILTTREAYDRGIFDKHELFRLGSPFLYCFIFQPAQLHVRSGTKRQIGLREYLDVNRGRGGQIVGFQEFSPGELSIGHVLKSTIGTIYGATDAFAHTDRLLFIADFKFMYKLDQQGYKCQYIDIKGQYSRFQEEEVPIYISDNLDYVANTIKVFHAGKALPDSNFAEINFVGNFDLTGYVVRVVKYCPETDTLDTDFSHNSRLYAGALEIASQSLN